MIKILYNISNGFPNPDAGGGNRIIYELLSGGLQDEFNTFFFSYLSKNIVPINVELKATIQNGIRIQKKIGHWLYKNIPVYKRITTSDFYKKKYYKQIINYIQSKSGSFNAFDIIHSHDTLSAGLSKNLAHSKKILTIHSKGSLYSEFKNSLTNQNRFTDWITIMQEIEKLNYFNSDLVTFPSKSAEKLFLDELKIDYRNKPKTEIIYNGIDLEKIKSFLNAPSENIFSKYGIRTSDSQLKIINVAEHVKEKNISLLIKSVELLNTVHKKDSILISIGQGPLSGDLKKLCGELSVTDKIFFLGNISNEDVIKILKECDFLVMTGEKIVFDLVILEAMAVGISVLASKTGGNLEIINDGENGYFLDQPNAENLAEKLVKINPGKVKQNANTTAERFSKKNMVNRFRGIYNELITD